MFEGFNPPARIRGWIFFIARAKKKSEHVCSGLRTKEGIFQICYAAYLDFWFHFVSSPRRFRRANPGRSAFIRYSPINAPCTPADVSFLRSCDEEIPLSLTNVISF